MQSAQRRSLVVQEFREAEVMRQLLGGAAAPLGVGLKGTEARH